MFLKMLSQSSFASWALLRTPARWGANHTPSVLISPVGDRSGKLLLPQCCI